MIQKKILEVYSKPEGLSRIYQSKLRRMSLPEIGELDVLSQTSETVSESDELKFQYNWKLGRIEELQKGGYGGSSFLARTL